jgi:predicted DNA-binding transcriptional regulator AlpA
MQAVKAASRTTSSPAKVWTPPLEDAAPTNDGATSIPPPRFIDKKQVVERVGVSYPTIWKWMRAGTFPRARVIGEKSVWLENEISTWMNTRPLRHLKDDGVSS